MISREEIGIQPHLNIRVRCHTLQPGSVTAHRQPLILVVKVAVVIGVTHRQSGNNGGRQLLRRGLPLLSGVVLNECLIQRAPNQRNALIVEVLRISTGQLPGLFSNKCFRFSR